MTTISFNYRAHRPTVVSRLRERLEVLAAEARGEGVRQRLIVHQRRVARAVAGALGAFGGLAMLATGVAVLAFDLDPMIASLALAVALSAVPVSYVVAFVVAPWMERRRMARLLTGSRDAERDLAIVEHASARTVVATWAARWERLSLTMPLVAVALLGPLALHAIVWLPEGDLPGLGKWIGASAVIVGHAHLVFAGLAVRYVRQLREGSLPSHPAIRMWGVVTLTSAIPGLLLFGLPPLLTGITGVFLVYPMCKWAEVALRRERVALSG